MGRAKTASGLRRAFSPAFRAGSLYPLAPLGAWVPKNLARRSMEVWLRRRRRRFRFSDFRFEAAAATLSGTGSASPRPDRNSWLRGSINPFPSPLHAREGADGQAVVCPLLRGSSPTRGVAPKQPRGLRRAFSPAFRAGSLYPLAPGCRRIWRGEVWKYGFGGAVADFVLVISGSRRRPRRSQVRGQLRHDPIATAG